MDLIGKDGEGMDVAVVVVDMQRDFLDPAQDSGVASLEKAFCVPGIERLLVHARERGWRVAHVGTLHTDPGSLPHHQRLQNDANVYCLAGSAGKEFVVLPGSDEPEFFKQAYSAFTANGLDDHLEGVETIIWAGVATDCCIQQSAFDANDREIRSLIPIEAVSASKCETFAISLSSISKSAADVVELEGVLASPQGEAEPLDSDTIEAKARDWFLRNEKLINRLGKSEINLDSVLAILRGQVNR